MPNDSGTSLASSSSAAATAASTALTWCVVPLVKNVKPLAGVRVWVKSWHAFTKAKCLHMRLLTPARSTGAMFVKEIINDVYPARWLALGMRSEERNRVQIVSPSHSL